MLFWNYKLCWFFAFICPVFELLISSQYIIHCKTYFLIIDMIVNPSLIYHLLILGFRILMWTRLSRNTINQLARLNLLFLSSHPLPKWIKELLQEKKKLACLLNYAQTAVMGVRYASHLHLFLLWCHLNFLQILYSWFWKLMQLGLCPEAASHVQEMKDKLIAVSNELLDNASNLSPEQIEKLREDRFVLLPPTMFVICCPPSMTRVFFFSCN